MEKLVLDACCGSRMFWFDKEDPRALFMDKRSVYAPVIQERVKKLGGKIVIKAEE